MAIESNNELSAYNIARGFNGKNRWPLIKSEKIFDLKYGKSLIASSRTLGKFPVYGSNGQCGWHDKLLQKGPGVILGRKGQGPLGVEWCSSDFWVIDTAYYLVLLSDLVDLKYAYYLIKYVGLNHLKDGTSNPSLSRQTFKSQFFPIPPIQKQKAIVKIISSLDDKIELNRQMNETLEAMARAIFRSWFVDFDPVRAKAEGTQPAGMDAETAALFPDEFEKVDGREVPRGWGVATLGDYIEVVKGLSYKGEGLCDDGIPMHNLNSVLEGGGYKYRGIKFYNGEYQERHIIHPGDVIVTNTEQGFDFLLIGYPAIIPKFYGETGLFSHHTFRVRPLSDSPLTNHFIYYLLMSPAVRERVIGCTNGTTVNMMYMDGLITPQFVLPSAQLIKEFEKIVSPMFDLMENYEQQSRTLAQSRDALLPKLMSGEVQVRSKDEDKNLT